jgi:hypothetical protein
VSATNYPRKFNSDNFLNITVMIAAFGLSECLPLGLSGKGRPLPSRDHICDGPTCQGSDALLCM